MHDLCSILLLISEAMIILTYLALHLYIVRPHIPKSLIVPLSSFDITRISQIPQYTRIPFIYRDILSSLDAGIGGTSIPQRFDLHCLRNQRPNIVKVVMSNPLVDGPKSVDRGSSDLMISLEINRSRNLAAVRFAGEAPEFPGRVVML